MPKETEQRAPFKERLARLQAKFKAPKDLVNEFGGFKFRNAEQMCDALKPLALEFGMLITATETVVGGEDNGAPGRVYKRVTVTAEDWYTDEKRTASAWAREMEHKTKMDDSQVSGLALSYAFKYALGLLLLVGTERDADSLTDAVDLTPARPQVANEALDAYREAFKACKQRMGLDKDALQASVNAQFGRTIGPDADVKTLQDATAWLQAQGVS